MDEREMVEMVEEALGLHEVEHDESGDVIRSIRSFGQAGVLTDNEGLVVRMNDGSEFQITVVKSK